MFKFIFLNHLLLNESLRIDLINKNIKAKLSSFNNSSWWIEHDDLNCVALGVVF